MRFRNSFVYELCGYVCTVTQALPLLFFEDRFAILTDRFTRCLICVPDREGSVFDARSTHRQTGFHCVFHAFALSQHLSLLLYHVQLLWLSGFFSSKSATNLQSARVSLGWHHVQPACPESVVSRAGYSTGHLSTCWLMLFTRTRRTCPNFYSFCFRSLTVWSISRI